MRTIKSIFQALVLAVAMSMSLTGCELYSDESIEKTTYYSEFDDSFESSGESAIVSHSNGYTAASGAAAIEETKEPEVYQYYKSEAYVTSRENSNKNIYEEIYRPMGNKEKYPTVVMSHGLGSSLSELQHGAITLAKSGYVAVIFDFCGGGDSIKSDGLTTDMSIITETKDLKAVIRDIQTKPYVDANNLFLMGFSQGGVVSAMVAADMQNEIKGLVLYYPAFNLVEVMNRQFSTVSEVPRRFSLLGVDLGQIYATDILGMNIYSKVSTYEKDIFIIHGDNDPIVPIDYSRRAILEYKSAELMTIEGGGHGFSGTDLEKTESSVLQYLKDHTRAY